MPRCKCGPKGRHCIRKSRLVQSDHIHIALAQEKIRFPGSSCPIQPIEIAALIENRRLRGIQILWLRIPHDTSAKPYHTTIDIHNREHDPVPELVMDSLFLIHACKP